ncbi:MAG: methyl-accepting chemotaxis protein [Mariprofundaceae bacterium]|nr:methyl-accepting chemotaxis protein [Mariprofundaceae bacterium]
MQKKSWKDKVKIKHRLGLIGLIAVIGLAVSTVMHINAISFLEQRSQENSSLAKSMEDFDMFQNHIRKQHVFLSGYLRNGILQGFSRWQNETQGNASKLSSLSQALPSDKGIQAGYQKIDTALQNYMKQVNQILTLRKELGLSEKLGLRGQLRKSVHQAEAQLKKHQLSALTISMLMLRRHEKDFMLRGKEKYIKKHHKEFKNFEVLLKASNVLEAVKGKLSLSMRDYAQAFHNYAKKTMILRSSLQSLGEYYTNNVELNFSHLDRQLGEYIEQKKDETFSRQAERDIQFFIMMAFIIAFIMGAIAWISGVMLKNIKVLMIFSERIASGNLEVDTRVKIRKHVQGELQVLLKLMERMRVNLVQNQTAIQKQADEGLRIKQALDSVHSSVMIADADYKIFYMNSSVQKMFHRNEKAFKTILPNFDVSALMGSNIDTFHKNPTHQRRLLDGLKSTYISDDLDISGHYVRITATPVFNEQGERIAIVTEWEDRTDHIKIESEIESFVANAVQGDFKNHISVEGKTEFSLKLAESLNAMNEVVDAAFTDTAIALKALEEGDLTYRISRDYEGVYDDIKQAANNTADKLANIMGNIRNTAMNVADGSSEISNGNTTLSDRTQEQAAALEETSASLEELTGTVQQNADNARQANQLAMTTSEQAEQGRKVVGQAIEAVEGISQSSKKIADIIGVIDEIAFQTNLLALNAAVEAARAGEQGRGFAVVAGEVRILAQRSAGAAKEIKELINASVDSVDQGSKLVNESGQALREIVHSVQKVTDIIAEIAAASQEQSQGVDQINKAITQLDSAVQQNAALVEETAASSANLDHEAGEVLASVSEFNLGDGQARSRTNTTRQTIASAAPRKPSKSLPSPSQAQNDEAWKEF